MECDILVIGSGIGGMVAAKKAADRGKRVILATSGKFCGGASFFPLKGTLGIQATDADEKDKELFYEDISRIGDEMDNPHMVEAYINEIRNGIGLLNEVGFEPWLRDDRRPACFAKYPRAIYLIDQWDEAKKRAEKIFSDLKNVNILEESKLVHIVKDSEKIAGGVLQRNKEFTFVKSPVIIMATGGISGLYKHNLYPKDVDGSGHMIMMDAGAQVVNMEFIQFIPAFFKPVYNTLYGEHTAKYCVGMYDDKGKELVKGIDCPEMKEMWLERSNYAPFSCDFSSHKIDLIMMDALVKGSEGITLKFSRELYEDQGEFYRVYLKWLKEKMDIDMCRDEIKIAPFAHGCNGGVKISQNGETGVKGLYAIGELSSAVEGANRLGGNSVGGALVFGKKAVDSAVEYLKECSDSQEIDIKMQFEKWLEKLLLKDGENIYTSEEVLAEIGDILWENGGIVRNEKKLNLSIERLESIKKSYSIKDNLEEKGLSVYFALEVAKMLFFAMLNRRESRGAHYREDYKKREDKSWRQVIYKKDGKLLFEKEFKEGL